MDDFLFAADFTRPLHLISMGRVAVDLYAQQIGSPLEEANSFRKYLGGCAGNIAVGVARLGLKSAMLSCVGTDKMGVFVRKTLEGEGVETTFLQSTSKHLTGLVLLGVEPPDQFPLIFYRENCADNHINPESITPDILEQASCLLVTGTGLAHPVSKKATLKAIALAREVGTKVILDIDYRPVLWGLTDVGDGETRYLTDSHVSAQLQAVLPSIDLLVGTEEEVMIAGGHADLEAAIAEIKRKTRAPLVLKKGALGAQVLAPGLQPITGESFQVDVLNVLGAGDAFMSGLLSGLLQQKTFAQSLTRANASGAIVVSRHGCAPAIPYQEELEQFIVARLAGEPMPVTQLDHLHARLELGSKRREPPSQIMAFCHRWQFESYCSEHKLDFNLISQFKTLIAKGVEKATRESPHVVNKPMILTDHHYGKDALHLAHKRQWPAFIPVEASGLRQLEWLVEGSLQRFLNEQPAQDGVKVLWRFHPQAEGKFKAHQLQKLIELHDICQDLNKPLLLEVILEDLPGGHLEALCQSVQAVYECKVYPYIWKVKALNSAKEVEQFELCLHEFDPSVRVVLLGGKTPSVDDLRVQFEPYGSAKKHTGFAVGRPIFWQTWMEFASGMATPDEVSERIAQNYTKACRFWKEK